MLYQISAPPVVALEKQADELSRLIKHSKTLMVQFVTVAGSYKPSRARLAAISAPDRFAEQAARVLAVICGREDAIRPSQPVRQRPEWRHMALLLPTAPDAPPLDGVMLDGWDSAFLSVTYRPGRASGRLLYCPEDRERVAALKLEGWRIIAKPNPPQQLAYAGGWPWNGVPSFAPVPGGAAAPTTPRTAAAERQVPPTIDAPAPLEQELQAALTKSPAGFLFGVTREGASLRLARRAMTLALSGSQEDRQRAVLGLLRRGMQDGMGIVAAIDRSLLPAADLQVWESRVRLLDVQNTADSSAIPWREIAPDLLAQAIGGPSASLPALPSRFGAVLDGLGAGALRVPAVLGLATMPGDNLRGALAAGGLVIVPQDGDAASAIVARLLLAYLATPPAIGRGLLLLADPALAPPEALREQAIQVVAGERGDALLRLRPAEAGWRLSAPDGSTVAELMPDLMAQPADGASDLVSSIVREIAAQAPVLASAAAPPIDATAGWWIAAERADDLEMLAATPAQESLDVDTPTGDLAADAVLPSNEQLPGELDSWLDDLLNQLTGDRLTHTNDAAIQAAVASAHFDQADTLAVFWAAHAPQLARPWLWRVVLAEADADRAVAAAQALQAEPAGQYARLARAVLAAMGTTGLASHADRGIELFGMPAQTDMNIRPDWVAEDATINLPAPLERADLHGSRLPEHAAPALSGEESWREIRVSAAHAAPDGAHGSNAPVSFGQKSCPAESLAARPALAAHAATPMLAGSLPPDGAAELSDDALLAAWHGGESVPQLVARLQATGMDGTVARARVRAIVNPRSQTATTALADRPIGDMNGIATPPMPAQAPAHADEIEAISALTPVASIIHSPISDASFMNAIPMPNMPIGELDDRAIWDCWTAGKRSDEIVVAISGRRGGPRAEAARDRMYRVVIPRIVAALNCGDLADRLVAGEAAADDPRYPTLMRQIARSENAPSGNLEQALAKRLIAARRELGP